MKIVLDTSVLVAAARSNRGASFALVRRLPDPAFTICLSVALYHEWLAVLSRPENLPQEQTPTDAQGFVRYLASVAHLQDIHFLWRPFLPDPDDDMVLELAFAAGASRIVTHNRRDFRGCESLGIEVISPSQFIKTLP
jgi:putative PIN family toxin of toxin-antitoxin system